MSSRHFFFVVGARVFSPKIAWPLEESWDQLGREVEGRLIKVPSPLAACVDAACAQTFKELKNPYYLGDQVGLTQSLGWVGAWASRPSVYAVAAKTTQDVVAAVDFARTNNLRLVVKGGGHSYQGSSNAADSLLIWTRQMNAVVLHYAFVGAGCEGRAEPQPPVSIEVGAIWGHVYNEVTTKGGRCVRGGGCMTVGVAGIILGGGFGSFSKAYGPAGTSLIEAEVVTADGEVRIANACSNPDLLWALKGGGGVTRVTARTHPLPEFFGAVSAVFKATYDDAYRRLIGRTVEFYAEALFNPYLGEQILIGRGYAAISMVFQTSTRWARSGTPTNPPSCRLRSSKPTGARAWQMRCLHRRSIRAWRCIATRDLRARRSSVEGGRAAPSADGSHRSDIS